MITLQVGAVNRPPVVDSVLPNMWRTGEVFAFDVVASDPEGHELIYRLLTPLGQPLPNGTCDISIDDNGHIQWDSPTAGQHQFTVRVAEKYYPASYEERTLSLTVLNSLPNLSPMIVGSPHGQYATLGQEFVYQFSPVDFDADNTGFVWSIAEGDLGDQMSIDSDGLFTWTPQVGEEGARTVKVRLTDVPATGNPAEAYVTFTLTAIDNHAPEITSPATLSPVIGTLFVHEIKARDPEGGPLTYAVDTSGGAIPAGLTIEGGTGLVWWHIPDELTTTSYSVPIVVTDPYGATARQTLSINVSLTDTVAPTISTRVVDGDGKIYLPGDELDAGGRYWLIVDITALAEAAQATGQAIDALRRLKLPMFPVIKRVMPDIYAFDVQCLSGRPDWHILVYNGPKSTLTDRNRAYVEKTWGYLRAIAPADYQLDEFPFASTAQGGLAGPAQGRMVPGHQNAVQGALLGVFYRYSLKSKPLPFLVVPVPI
jgi:hypothetical protein